MNKKSNAHGHFRCCRSLLLCYLFLHFCFSLSLSLSVFFLLVVFFCYLAGMSVSRFANSERSSTIKNRSINNQMQLAAMCCCFVVGFGNFVLIAQFCIIRPVYNFIFFFRFAFHFDWTCVCVFVAALQYA